MKEIVKAFNLKRSHLVEAIVALKVMSVISAMGMSLGRPRLGALGRECSLGVVGLQALVLGAVQPKVTACVCNQ